MPSLTRTSAIELAASLRRRELSAREFFTKALKTHHPRWPTKLNLDGNAASQRALYVLRQETTP